MSTLVWALVAPLVLVLAGAAALVLRRRARRRRQPTTRAEQLAAAAKAARELRRSGPRPHRDTFQRGADPTDRYSPAIAENSVYGDAATFGDGGGGASSY